MIEALIKELIEALKANTEAVKAFNTPTSLPPEPPSSVTTSQGSTMVTHDQTVIAQGAAVLKTVVEAVEADPAVVEPPKRRGRPPKSAAPVETPQNYGSTINEMVEKVDPEVAKRVVTPEVVEPPKPQVTLEQVRAMGQKLLDLTGDTSVIKAYVNERGCKALRELPPEQWAAAHDFLSEKVAAVQG